jgi:hypothetical protein
MRTIYKFYFLTWVMFLIWRKRNIPQWLREQVVETIEPEIVMPEIVKYVK